MTPFPREGFRALRRYTPIEDPVEIELSDNTNLWGCHPDALAVMRDAVSGDISNYPQAYSSELRDAVADKFDVRADCVITGCGSDDVLDSTFRAACEPGARVAFPNPTFLMIPHLLVVNSLRGVPLGDARRPPSPRQLLDAAADLIYVCTPNNPTGTALSRAWVDELLDGVGATGPVVILDEAYYEFNVASPGYDPGDTSLVERALAVPRIMIARTFSKAYGLAGLRAGFGIAHPDLLGEVEKARGPFKVGLLAERAAAAALRDRSGWLEPTVREIVACRERLVAELRRRGGDPLPSSANFIMLPVPAPAVEVTREMIARGIAVRPFPNVPGVGEALRVTVGPPPVIERFIEAWDDICHPAAGDAGQEAIAAEAAG